MNRRSFLKLIGVTPIAPSVLVAIPKKELTVITAREFVDKMPEFKPNYAQKMIADTIPFAIALEDIPKDKYGWVRIYTQAQFICEQPTRSGKLVNVE